MKNIVAIRNHICAMYMTPINGGGFYLEIGGKGRDSFLDCADPNCISLYIVWY